MGSFINRGWKFTYCGVLGKIFVFCSSVTLDGCCSSGPDRERALLCYCNGASADANVSMLAISGLFTSLTDFETAPTPQSYELNRKYEFSFSCFLILFMFVSFQLRGWNSDFHSPVKQDHQTGDIRSPTSGDHLLPVGRGNGARDTCWHYPASPETQTHRTLWPLVRWGNPGCHDCINRCISSSFDQMI